MPTLQELSDKVSEVQTALDVEQQQVADLLAQKDATITTLNETIAQLETEGGTEEGRAAVMAKLVAMKDDLEGTVTPGTTEEPPAGEPQ